MLIPSSLASQTRAARVVLTLSPCSAALPTISLLLMRRNKGRCSVLAAFHQHCNFATEQPLLSLYGRSRRSLDINLSAIVVLEGIVYRGRRSRRMGDSNTHLIERIDYIARRVQPLD